MNLTKQEKKQLRAAVIILLAYLAVSVFFWLAVRWWAAFIPTVVILLAEYILQVRKHKTFKIPIVRRVLAAIEWGWEHRVVFRSGKFSVEGIPAVADQCNVVDNIANIKAYDFFVTCIGKGDYSPIGTGSVAQLQNAFNELLSQYYEVRGDERMKLEIKLRLDIGVYEYRRDYVAAMCGVLKGFCSPVAAKKLRELFKGQYLLTEDTLVNDLSMIEKGEIAGAIEYERNKKKLEKLHASAGSQQVKNSVVQNAKAFTSTVLAINTVLNSRHDIHVITLMEYAIGEQQLQDHINNLNENKHGR